MPIDFKDFEAKTEKEIENIVKIWTNSINVFLNKKKTTYEFMKYGRVYFPLDKDGISEHKEIIEIMFAYREAVELMKILKEEIVQIYDKKGWNIEYRNEKGCITGMYFSKH